jgi:SPX domain protein involved in polyphosphate accumulation
MKERIIMKNPITYLKEKQEEKKMVEKCEAERKRKRAGKQLNAKFVESEKRLNTCLKKAEADFVEAMDAEDHGLAKIHANSIKSYENDLKRLKGLKRESERARNIVETQGVAIETLQGLKELTDLTEISVGGQVSLTDLDKLRASIERKLDNITRYAEESEEFIGEMVAISAEDEITDDELKAMKERYLASKVAKEGGIKATEGADKEITDMLSSLGSPVGSF